MKKVLVILIALLCLCSCKDYKCVLKYEVSYPDTTWVHTYVFDGDHTAHVSIYKSSDGGKVLNIYPTSWTIVQHEIAAVPGENTNITIHDFKIYRYGIDIPNKKK